MSIIQRIEQCEQQLAELQSELATLKKLAQAELSSSDVREEASPPESIDAAVVESA